MSRRDKLAQGVCGAACCAILAVLIFLAAQPPHLTCDPYYNTCAAYDSFETECHGIFGKDRLALCPQGPDAPLSTKVYPHRPRR